MEAVESLLTRLSVDCERTRRQLPRHTVPPAIIYPMSYGVHVSLVRSMSLVRRARFGVAI